MNVLMELQRRVSLFAAGHVSLEDFEAWFLGALWDVERSPNIRAKSEFHNIEGLLAEASHAHWTIEGIRKELENAVRAFARTATAPLGNPTGTPKTMFWRRFPSSEPQTKFGATTPAQFAHAA